MMASMYHRPNCCSDYSKTNVSFENVFCPTDHETDRRGEAIILVFCFIIERSEAAQIYNPGSLNELGMLSNTRETVDV
jgi:hypothetical protein